MITGYVPIEANERLIDDTLKSPSELGVPIDPRIEFAITSGLAVFQKNRIQDIGVLYNVFYEDGSAAVRTDIRTPNSKDNRTPL